MRAVPIRFLVLLLWVLATSADASTRDPLRALALAERAVVLTRRGDETSLDTMAVALAGIGRRDEAAAVGAEAVARAREHGNRALLPELEQRLASYR